MLDYMIAGLALGAIYAIVASGLVVTYVSSGVLNFSFAGIAYFLARFFYFLDTTHGWATLPALLVTVLIVAPAMGVTLYVVLFRHLTQSTTLIKVVVTIGLSVAIPAVARTLFGSLPISQVPGLAPAPVRIFRVGGVNISLDQLFVFAALLTLVVIGGLVLRFTTIGLAVRATVDSAAMTSLCGVSPQRVQLAVWAVSTMLAGLAGVLVAPIIGLVSDQFIVVMTAAMAAVIAAQLTNLGMSIVAGLMLGVITSVLQWALPSSSSLTAAILPSVPCAIIVVVLLWQLARGRGTNEAEGIGGALDRAIVPATEKPSQSSTTQRGVGAGTGRGMLAGRLSPGAIGVLVVVALLPLTLQDFWVGLVAQGIAFAIVFLSFSVVTGQGGMIWLNHATLAGVGGLTFAQLSTVYAWPALLAITVSGLVAAVIGIFVATLTARLGVLYVALVTLSVGLLIERLVFTRERFSQSGSGVIVERPGFMVTDRDFAYAALVVFCLLALVIYNLRRSTAGLVLSAVRSSEPAARSLGVSVLQAKLIASALAAFVAGVGGAFLVLYSYSSAPDGFATIAGLTWLAVVVAIGVRTCTAALLGGVIFGVVPGLFATYVPTEWGELPAILFGLGGVLVARNPHGVVAMHADQLRWLGGAVRSQWRRTPESVHPVELEQVR